MSDAMKRTCKLSLRALPGKTCLLCLILAAALTAGGAEDRKKQYDADVPKTVLELQQFRQSVSAPVRSGAGREGEATLVDLNPRIGVWYVLQIDWKGAAAEALHLENPNPGESHLILDGRYPSGIVVETGTSRYPCELFGTVDVIEQARSSKLGFFPLCHGRIYLRNPVKGHSTALESTVDFLRDRVWGGEQVIDVFHHLLADRYRETGEPGSTGTAPRNPDVSEAPRPGVIDAKNTGRPIIPAGLGIALRTEGPERNGMIPGTWYEGANPGTWVSVMRPDYLPPSIFQSYRNLVSNLDRVELSSLCYLMAFDLSQFDLGYELGTDHPRVDWSDRVTGAMRDTRLPGPDGIGTIAPLLAVGTIRPDDVPRTVATFIGGFKRMHGAFRYGDLALRNHGSHYGFIENGAVLSKLQPGLATVFALDDGTVGMKTWTLADNALLERIRHARQNGVPLVESNGAGAREAAPVPGSLVNRWGPGNWSGSQDEKLRTMRAGLALQRVGGKTFLIYAVFTDATPSAMARVFQAYGVDYAMLLDMNALEHTYLAVYRRSGGELSVDHLLTGMSELDKLPSGELVPRFLGYSDNRDFFYLMRRSAKEQKR